jgi:hypothetical protein
MNTKNKNRYKKIANIFFWSEIISLLLLLLSIIFVFSLNKLINSALLYIIICSVLLTIYFISHYYSGKYGDKLIVYKHKILMYRNYNKFQLIIDAVLMNDLEKAVIIYHDIPDGEMKDTLFGLLIAEKRHSDKKEEQEHGVELIKDLCKLYNPDKVKL